MGQLVLRGGEGGDPSSDDDDYDGRCDGRVADRDGDGGGDYSRCGSFGREEDMVSSPAPFVSILRMWAVGARADGSRIDTHYQWVIMIVVLGIAFVGGWIAACFFRRRYLRKRELNFEMRPPNAPWVTGHTGPYGAGLDGMGGDLGKEGTMMTSAMPAAEIKKEKKKWVVNERT